MTQQNHNSSKRELEGAHDYLPLGILCWVCYTLWLIIFIYEETIPLPNSVLFINPPSFLRYILIGISGGSSLILVRMSLKRHNSTRPQVIESDSSPTLPKDKETEAKLEVLHDWAQLLNKAETMDEVFQYTLDAIEETLGFEYAGILLKKENILKLEKYRGVEYPEDLREIPLDGRGITTKAVNSGKTILFKDIKKQTKQLPLYPKIRAELITPITIEGEVIGVLNVESRKRSAFDQRDKRLAEILASHAAVAIHKLRKEKQRREKEAKLEVLHDWAQLLNKAETMDEVFQYTLDAIEETLGFEYAGILLKKENILKLEKYRGVEYPEDLREIPLDGRGITTKAVNSGKTILFKDIKKQTKQLPLYPIFNSELVVPIKSDENIIGVLNVESRKRSAFDQRDKRLAEILASHAAVAIKKLREKEHRVSLQRLDKLRNRFLMMAAHEINTPLTPIKTDLEMLKKEYHGELSNEQGKRVDFILKNIDRLTQLVEDFRRISKLQTKNIRLRKDRYQLANTIENIVSEYQHVFREENIQLIKKVQKSLYAIYDEHKITQVIQNLVKNAIDYTDDRILIKAQDLGEQIKVIVSDNGVGIPEDEQEKIFEPFYRVESGRNRGNRRYGGTGIGLNICKEIIQAHNGEIRVNSTPGEGSRFIFTLPKRNE